MPPSMNRREFLALAVLAPSAGCAGTSVPDPTGGAPTHRTLGRTGLRVSEVGMGVMISGNPELVRAALDAGVNYFDTARSYMGGRNEAILAEGLGSRRHEAIIATKCHVLGRRARLIATVEQSLQTLRTDTIDVLQLHGLSTREQVLLPDHLEALDALRQSGKIRFAGVTTHSNMAAVMDAAVEAGVYDTVLTSFNFRSPPEVIEAAHRAARAGLGVVAMKIMTGGYTAETFPGLNPYQSALRWVLERPFVATTIPSMASFEQVRQNTEVMGTRLGWRDDAALRAYARSVDLRYCRGCGGCDGTCPRDADVPSALRGLMYAQGYRQIEMARRTVRRADLPCEGCPSCSVRCRFGVPVRERLAEARRLVDGVPG